MKAKLIKKEEEFSLCIHHEGTNQFIASTDGMYVEYTLSVKNCQDIERGYDLDELAYNCSIEWHGEKFDSSIEIYKEAFQKALELMGDKKFSEDDVRKAITGFYMDDKILIESNINKQIQSLQQTEWDVEIEMDICGDKVYEVLEPKLDADGCLILKRKSE